MFGYYDIPFSIVQDAISLSCEREGDSVLYKRECNGEIVEKFLLTSNSKILLNPVEPVNKPKPLTSELLIELGKPLIVEPKVTQKVFLAFPIEIGVFLSQDNCIENIDVFTLHRPKLTLYGDPRTGVICKYYKSKVYSTIPSVKLIHEGIIELTITNQTINWIEATKIVFNAYGMQIYYNDSMAYMKAVMELVSKGRAETDFEDAPLKEGMNKSLELYTSKIISIISTKFVMELGL
jgi:hypothetical protein